MLSTEESFDSRVSTRCISKKNETQQTKPVLPACLTRSKEQNFPSNTLDLSEFINNIAICENSNSYNSTGSNERAKAISNQFFSDGKKEKQSINCLKCISGQSILFAL